MRIIYVSLQGKHMVLNQERSAVSRMFTFEHKELSGV